MDDAPGPAGGPPTSMAGAPATDAPEGPRNPLGFALGLWAGLLAVGVIVAETAARLGLFRSNTAVGLTSTLVAAALVTVVVHRLGWWTEVGFRRPDRPDWLRVSAPAVVWGLLPLGLGVAWHGGVFAVVSVAAILVSALTEEVAFRGLILRAFARRGTFFAAIASSVLFGALHISRLSLSSDVVTTLVLVVTTMLAGIGYAAIRIRTGTIWAPVAVHVLYNVTVGFIPSDPADAFFDAGVWTRVVFISTAAFMAYGVHLLRNDPPISPPLPPRIELMPRPPEDDGERH